jgi:hypothetical protein
MPDQPWRSIMLQAVTWARGGSARHMSDFTAAQRPSATVTKRPQHAAGSVMAARRHIRVTARLVRRISGIDRASAGGNRPLHNETS